MINAPGNRVKRRLLFQKTQTPSVGVEPTVKARAFQRFNDGLLSVFLTFEGRLSAESIGLVESYDLRDNVTCDKG